MGQIILSKLDAIRAFVTIVEHGSFSAAARALVVSKSMLSRQVRGLEEELGIQLLFRTTRELRTTDAGALFFERCQRALKDLSEAHELVNDYSVDVRGQLRVLAADLFAEQYIAPILARCMIDHPELRIELDIASDIRNLISDDYDIAIRYGELPDSSILATKIFELPHVVAASPSYLAAFGQPTKPADLAGHKCLTGSLEPCRAWRFSEGGRESRLQLDGVWRSNSGATLVSVCLAGLGICWLPEIYLRPFLISGALVPLLTEFQSVPFPVWATFPSGRHVPMKTKMVVDLLRQELSKLSQGAYGTEVPLQVIAGGR